MNEPKWVLSRGWHDEIPAYPHAKMTHRKLTRDEVQRGWSAFAFDTEAEAWAAQIRWLEDMRDDTQAALTAIETELAEARAKTRAEPGA